MVVPLETGPAENPDIIQFIGLALEVYEPPGAGIYGVGAAPTAGNMPVICALALVARSSEDIEPVLRSIFHGLPSRAEESLVRFAFSGYRAALALRSRAISTSSAR